MKIVHVIPSLNRGGAERLCIDICKELSKRKNISVKIIVLSDNNEYVEQSEGLDIEYCQVNFELSILKNNKIEISSYSNSIDNYAPDVIHSHLYRSEIITREIINYKAKYFTHLHDNIPQLLKGSFRTFFNKARLTNYFERRRLLKKYSSCENNFIAISNHTSSYFNENLPKELNDITLIPNAINLNQFLKPKNWSSKMVRGINLVSIGSLVDKKNHIFLVDVVERLISRGFSPKLLILGEGPKRDFLEKAITKKKLNKYIDLIGTVNNVEEFLWDADVYVHSAFYEPFGLVLLEAMAAELPCVSVDGGGNRDVITNKVNGFIIEKEDPDFFVDAIIRLKQDEKLRQKIVSNASVFVKNFGIKEYVDKLISLYSKSLLS